MTSEPSSELRFNPIRESSTSVVHAVARWAVDHHKTLEANGMRWPDSAAAVPLEHLFRPLLSLLLPDDTKTACAWCVAGIRIASEQIYMGPGSESAFYHFEPHARREVAQQPGWQLSSLLGRMSRRRHTRPFQIVLTTDLCAEHLRDGVPLILARVDDFGGAATAGQGAWRVGLQTIGYRINDEATRINECLHAIAEANVAGEDQTQQEFEKSLSKLDDILEVLARDAVKDLTIEGPAAPDREWKLRAELCRNNGLAIAKYAAIMTAVWPGWKRIVMLPHMGPSIGDTKGGGIVVCEDSDGDGLSLEEMQDVSAIGSVPTWVCLPFLAPVDPLPVAHDTLLARLGDTKNDYGSLEEAFRVRCGVDLVNRETAPNRTCEAVRARYLQALDPPCCSVSVVIPVFGSEHALSECLKSIGRERFVVRFPDSVEILVIEDGQEEGRYHVSPHDLKGLGLRCKLRLFRLREQSGPSTARNVGVFNAANTVIAFVDAHMVLADDCLYEQVFRHEQLGPSVALQGFKEGVSREVLAARWADCLSGSWRPDFRKDWRCSHILNDDDLKDYAFYNPFLGRAMGRGEEVDYMALTDWLKALVGIRRVGPRMLAGFFQTNLLSVNRSAIVDVGGFDERFGRLWGYEDALLGALLLARGIKLVPCPSATAFKVEHLDQRPKPEDATLNAQHFWTELRHGKLQGHAYSASGLRSKVTRTRAEEIPV